MNIWRRLYSLAYDAVYLASSLFSRSVNTIAFGGDPDMTLSARAYIETSPKWQRIRRLIDAVFFFQPNHCARAWEAEVARAMVVLMREDARIFTQE